jgi:hypothetical protein
MRELPPPNRDFSERERTKAQITRALAISGALLMEEGRARSFEVHSEHDQHLFVRSSAEPSRVIHLQAYTGFSVNGVLVFSAREMDHERLMKIRADAQRNGGPSIGNEHDAVVRELIDQSHVDMDPETIEFKLEAFLPTVRNQPDETLRHL